MIFIDYELWEHQDIRHEDPKLARKRSLWEPQTCIRAANNKSLLSRL